MIEAGNRIGRYVVQHRLGQGAMGAVYLAYDALLGRRVAIKIFPGDLKERDLLDRFSRDARQAGALSHRNIAVLYDFGEFSSQQYIVTEFVEGETLREKIRSKSPVPLLEKLRWMEDLCAAVEYAHKAGVIHRDITPANLMIDHSGQLKVLDFGMGRLRQALGAGDTLVLGDPRYMAPEQILGHTVDQRSDLFSIGAVCYELLSSREAFSGDSFSAVIHRVLNQDPVRLAEIVPDIDQDLAAIVERTLQKSIDDRFPDATALGRAFRGVRRRLEGAVVVTRTLQRVEAVLPRADELIAEPSVSIGFPADRFLPDTHATRDIVLYGLIVTAALFGLASALRTLPPFSTTLTTSRAEVVWRTLMASGVAVCGVALVLTVVRHLIEFVAAILLVNKLRKQ